VSGFTAEWLRLREPADAAARDSSLVLAQARPQIAVVDLGAGTGANLRYTAPRLGGSQTWTLVDHDPALLAAGTAAAAEWAAACDQESRELKVAVAWRELDLARNLAALELPRGALVTSSALLDLVSASWLDELAQRCAAVEAPVLFALIYDGRTACEPAELEDSEVLALFNRHQLGDKSFGPALGPAAARATQQAFEKVGYRVETRASDWRLEPGDAALQRSLVDGWLGAALEIAPHRATALRDWHRRRLEHVERGRSRIMVGHADVSGRPSRVLPSREDAVRARE
jgi:hypothetical protein